MKKLLSVLLCAVMVLSLAACGKKENAPTPGPDPNGETEGLTVALVVAGKLGDRSFYDSSKEGLDRMVTDLGDRKSTRLNSSHNVISRMPSSA